MSLGRDTHSCRSPATALILRAKITQGGAILPVQHTRRFGSNGAIGPAFGRPTCEPSSLPRPAAEAIGGRAILRAFVAVFRTVCGFFEVLPLSDSLWLRF